MQINRRWFYSVNKSIVLTVYNESCDKCKSLQKLARNATLKKFLVPFAENKRINRSNGKLNGGRTNL